jgi:hypothetical protein
MAEVGELPITPPAESRWLRWGMGIADKLKSVGRYHNPEIDGDTLSSHKQHKELAIGSESPLAPESAEKPSLMEKRIIIARAYERLISMDRKREESGDSPELFCTDHFLPLSDQVIISRELHSNVQLGIDTRPAFSVDENTPGAHPSVNRVTFGRHKVLSLAKPIEIDGQIYWEVVKKGEGPTGAFRRKQYREFTENHPGDPVGLTSVKSVKTDKNITGILTDLGVRTGVVVETQTLNATALEQELHGVSIVESTTRYTHKPYVLTEEIDKIARNGDQPATELRVQGGDRLSNIIGLNPDQRYCFIQANSAMLGYEIDKIGVEEFIQKYQIPDELKPDIKFLAQLGNDTFWDPEQIVLPLLSISSYLHIKNALLLREYNLTRPNDQILPASKASDLDWQGRCYDFETTQKDAIHDQGYFESQLVAALDWQAEELDKVFSKSGIKYKKRLHQLLGTYFDSHFGEELQISKPASKITDVGNDLTMRVSHKGNYDAQNAEVAAQFVKEQSVAIQDEALGNLLLVELTPEERELLQLSESMTREFFQKKLRQLGLESSGVEQLVVHYITPVNDELGGSTKPIQDLITVTIDRKHLDLFNTACIAAHEIGYKLSRQELQFYWQNPETPSSMVVLLGFQKSGLVNKLGKGIDNGLAMLDEVDVGVEVLKKIFPFESAFRKAVVERGLLKEQIAEVEKSIFGNVDLASLDPFITLSTRKNVENNPSIGLDVNSLKNYLFTQELCRTLGHFLAKERNLVGATDQEKILLGRDILDKDRFFNTLDKTTQQHDGLKTMIRIFGGRRTRTLLELDDEFNGLDEAMQTVREVQREIRL